MVGPYQGTLGCLHIAFSQGVCGKAAREKKTQIVQEVHALAQGSEHIACDPNSQSEIVVPVLNKEGALLVVFDVDSTLQGSFDEVDQTFLEKLLQEAIAFQFFRFMQFLSLISESLLMPPDPFALLLLKT